MANIAIVTARGGSKRIPHKNIKEFCGVPIIKYSIDAAIKSGLFDEIMVSTDDFQIAEIAKSFGANVPFMRSEETASDFATTSDVLMEVFNRYIELGKNFEYACCLYPTAPFISAEKLVEGMKILKEKKASGVVPVVKFSYPPQRCYILDEKGQISYKWPEFAKSRSQDLEQYYHDIGQFYFYNVKEYIETKGDFHGNVYSMPIPESEVQDIDSPEDWKVAEMKYKILNGLI